VLARRGLEAAVRQEIRVSARDYAVVVAAKQGAVDVHVASGFLVDRIAEVRGAEQHFYKVGVHARIVARPATASSARPGSEQCGCLTESR
jgi:hypothetical protein